MYNFILREKAVVLLNKLKIFEDEIEKRNYVANYYSENLYKILKTPFIEKQNISSWAQFSLIAKSKIEKNAYMQRLKKNNIPSMVYYRIPLHLQKVFKDLDNKEGSFPNAEECSEKIFSIPMHPYLTKSEQQLIVDVINNG